MFVTKVIVVLQCLLVFRCFLNIIILLQKNLTCNNLHESCAYIDALEVMHIFPRNWHFAHSCFIIYVIFLSYIFYFPLSYLTYEHRIPCLELGAYISAPRVTRVFIRAWSYALIFTRLKLCASIYLFLYIF
jgi:hypothetical protein